MGVSTPRTTHRDSHTALASKGQEKRKRGRSSACSSQREWEDGANGGPSWVGSLATGQMGHQRVPTGKILRFRRWQILIGLASLKSPETASRNVQYPLRAWLGAVVHNPKPTQTVGHRIFTAQRHWTICAGWVHSQRLQSSSLLRATSSRERNWDLGPSQPQAGRNQGMRLWKGSDSSSKSKGHLDCSLQNWYQPNVAGTPRSRSG